jgi:NAD-dependent SIR2 family protein deacetylase
VPHAGFAILRRIGEGLPQGAFVFTSNVDGQFQKAGFAAERIVECHGSIHHLQCLDACHQGIWPADDYQPQVDEEECLLRSDFPRCPRCRAIARPNILMFGDWGWLAQRTDDQESRLHIWLRQVDRLLVIEIGAGTNIPTVRMLGEQSRGRLIRINPSEPQLPPGKGVALAAGGLAGLRAIAAVLG